MFNIVNKEEYFDWLEKGIADQKNHSLKGIQDAWILSLLSGKKNLKIAEVGGGQSRVLQSVRQDNECWNIDKFEGVGAGPKGVPAMEGIKVVPLYLGNFDETLPNNYFDVVFSISVVEHVPGSNLNNFFADCHRILKPGGIMIHAIDLYIGDESENIQLVKLYRQAMNKLEFEWFVQPEINKEITFKCSYASNSDITMHQWNQVAPVLRKKRENSQSVVLKLAGFRRTEAGVDVSPDIAELREISQRLKVEHASKKTEQKKIREAIPKTPLEKPQDSSTINITDESTVQTSTTLISSLFGRIAKYYSRWPALLAALAVLLNTIAWLDVIATPLQWVLAATGTIILLFLIGHAASKADYVLLEVEKLKK